jgi:mannose-6-phosphate isomerase-like protein (cupin superfamily)
MRRLITGIDSDGRSCVIRETEIARREPAVDIHSVFMTHGSPPPTRPPGRAEYQDVDVHPGQVHWLVSYWAAGEETPLHHTDTLDFAIVLDGSMDLLLDDGAHRLERNDCVVIAGVDHGWRAGPEGATMSIALLGTPAPKVRRLGIRRRH